MLLFWALAVIRPVNISLRVEAALSVSLVVPFTLAAVTSSLTAGISSAATSMASAALMAVSREIVTLAAMGLPRPPKLKALTALTAAARALAVVDTAKMALMSSVKITFSTTLTKEDAMGVDLIISLLATFFLKIFLKASDESIG